MKRRFTESQIVSILKESEAGANTKELCRRRGISIHTFYSWKQKFGGMETRDIAKMRVLEEENRRLKKAVADLVLEKEALKIVAEGNF